MRWYSIEQRTIKYVKWYVYSSFARKYKKLDTGLHAVKTTSKTVVHKAGKFIGNKIMDTGMKKCQGMKKLWNRSPLKK